MRRVKFFVTTSLDGFIGGPNEEVDWLFTDQDYGMGEFYNSIDTVLIGRKTHDFMRKRSQKAYGNKWNYVFSRTERSGICPSLRHEVGKNIWLVGGASLFAYLLDHGLVDEIILAVHPILIGKGIAHFPRHS